MMKLLYSSLFVVLAMMIFAGCSSSSSGDGPSGQTCLWDLDCPRFGDRCIEGICRPADEPGPGPTPPDNGDDPDGGDPGPPAQECETSDQCPGDNMECRNGQCVFVCQNNEDCDGDQVCVAGVCQQPTSECVDDAFAGNHSVQSAHLLTAGTHNDLKLCHADADFFSIYLEQGGEINVAATYSSSNGELRMELRAPNGNDVLALDSADGDNSRRIQYTAAAAGFHILRVFLQNDTGDVPYSLILSVTNPPDPGPDPGPGPGDPDPNDPNDPDDPDEPGPGPGPGDPSDPDDPDDPEPPPACDDDDQYAGNHHPDDAVLLEPGVYEDLLICPGLADWFQVAAQQGDRVRIHIAFSHADGDLDLRIADPGLQEWVAWSETEDNDEEVNFTATQNGNYYIAVFGYDDQAPETVTNRYTMTIEVVSAWECIEDQFSPNYSRETAAPITNGSYSNLYRCPGESDWYSLEMTQGDRYEFRLNHTAADGQLTLRLVNSSGTTIRSTTSTGNSVSLVHPHGGHPTAGTHYLEVTYREAWDNVEPVGNSYSLSIDLTPGCAPDQFTPNHTMNTAAPITSGDYDDLFLCRDSSDWFEVQLQRDDVYEFVVDWDDTLLSSIRTYVRNGSGNALQTDTSSWNKPKVLSGKAAYTGAHYLEVNTSSNSTTYSVSFFAEPECIEDQFHGNDSLASASPIDQGSYGDLFICPGEEDWFAIELEEGRQYRFSKVHERSRGSLELHLCTSATNCPRSASGNDTNTISGYVAPSTGTYYLRVRRSGWADVRNHYSLSFTQQ